MPPPAPTLCSTLPSPCPPFPVAVTSLLSVPLWSSYMFFGYSLHFLPSSLLHSPPPHSCQFVLRIHTSGSPGSFKVLTLIFRVIIFFELNFGYGVKMRIGFLFYFCMWIFFPSPFVENNILSTLKYTDTFVGNQWAIYTHVGLFLDSVFCSIDLHVNTRLTWLL